MARSQAKGRNVSRWLLINGVRKGLIGGSNLWLVIGGAAGLVRLFKRLGRGGPAVVYSESLAPGESVLISHGVNPR